MSNTPEPRREALAALEARVAQLEAEVAALRASSRLPPPTTTDPQPQPPPPSPDALVRLTPPAPAAAPPAPPRPGIAVESETVLKWVGVGLVVLAVGFAVSTAISRGWIGPELQLAGAVAFSIALVGVGLRLRATRMPWAHALCSGGIAALYTTFASNLFVDETSADVAYVALAAVAVAAFALARFVPSEWVGAVALTGVLIGWFVVGDGDPPFGTTLGLSVTVALVAVLISLERGWFALRLLGHLTAIVMIIGLAADADTAAREAAVVAAAALTFLSLTRVPSIGARVRRDGPDRVVDPWHQIEVQLAMVAAPWLVATLAEALEIDEGTDLGLLAFAVAAAQAGLAFALEPRLRRVHLVSLVVGTSIAVTIALAALLDTEAIFVALALQGVGLLTLRRYFERSVRLPINAGILLFVAAMFALVGGLEAWSEDAAIGVDLAHLAVIVVLGVAAWQTGIDVVRRWGAAAVLGLTLVWLGSVLVHLPEGQAAVSIAWAVVGTALLVAGAVRKVPDWGGAGLAVLALTVGKLLFVDMREVDTLWRAGLFFLVGLGLMRLGFLLPRLTGDPTRRPVAGSTAPDPQG